METAHPPPRGGGICTYSFDLANELYPIPFAMLAGLGGTTISFSICGRGRLSFRQSGPRIVLGPEVCGGRDSAV
jgi:hypothetical protein